MKTRIVQSETLKHKVKELVYKANFMLPERVIRLYEEMLSQEESETARSVLSILLENARIAKNDELPLCQDCGTAILFVEIGQEVLFDGDIGNALQEGVAEAYRDFYLRKSIVSDPLKRINTNTNTPASIHFNLCPGDVIRLTVYLKGGGSENMSSLKMFTPTAGEDAIIEYIVDRVSEAGPNPCPPVFLGVGIGGTADEAVLNSKKAVILGLYSQNEDPFYASLEERVRQAVNALNIGPLGFGGSVTAASVRILQAPTHIATLPVAVNMNCHSLRYWTETL